MRYDRCRKLFGSDFTKIEDAKIIILGVGGVGGFALDCLYKSGVKNITIVDYDTFDITNQNRQIGSEAIGIKKVQRLKELYPNIKIIDQKIDVKWIESFDMSKYDLILDAIDDMTPKIRLITQYYKKLISTTGSAKRIDPTKVEYVDIFKTYNDPFAKKIRERLKKKKFTKKFKIIFSSELPYSKEFGSFEAVTGSFGLVMCAKTIEKLISL